MESSRVLERCLLLDLETHGDRITRIGAVYQDKTFRRRGRFPATDILGDLQQFAREARAVLGHNVLDHDLPILRSQAPWLNVLRIPVIDTLYLSPLAFPENPYHRLVKDYKLVKDSINDPVADARLAASIFEDQWNSFAAWMSAGQQEILSFYRFCFHLEEPAAAKMDAGGMARLFAQLGASLPSRSEARDIFRRHVANQVCSTALERMVTSSFRGSPDRPALAYVFSWLRVAGSNSVLPPWVRYRFPRVKTLIKELRDVPCDASACAYCRTTLNPTTQLKRLFNFPTFRAAPATDDGDSLQEAIVRAGMRDRPSLAILPTGGGKSLCYQLPALVRHFRRGLLTIVISPLQALMKDQVDNLTERTGTPYAAALYGLLTPPERGEVLERVRLGDIAILYVAPEQLRNRSFREAIRHREIGAWVFDEAHCLSKWGHDFRPDYLYAGRFIREFAAARTPSVSPGASPETSPEVSPEIPPIFCFTATAKQDVKEEILSFFQSELDQDLLVFEAGVGRDNLQFEVHMVARAEKYSTIHTILEDRLPSDNGGAAIVYTATRRGAVAIAEYLKQQGWAAGAFHGGLNPIAKRAVQEAFIQGSIRVIAATNAFGMGIDKDDIRLVLHADIPGSLENYLQEAGRAGRDLADAQCVLLYQEDDIETQFMLGALSKLNRGDIAQILRGLRKSRRNAEGSIIITSGELLRDEDVETSFENDDIQADTKVKSAISWLERAGFLERNENLTRIFQGRVAVKTMEEARRRIDSLRLAPAAKTRWLAVLQTLFNADPDQGISADELAELPVFGDSDEKTGGGEGRQQTSTERVLRTLHQMADAGLIEKGLLLTAFVRHKVANPSSLMLDRIRRLEMDLLRVLREAAPDAAEMEWLDLSLRQLNQKLKDMGHACTPEILRNLLKSLSLDGKGLAGSRGSLEYRHVHTDYYRVKLLRSWDAVVKTAKKRHAVAHVVLQAILRRIPENAPARADLLVDFSSEDLVEAVRKHPVLSPEVKDPLAAIDRGLMFLHEQKVILLQQGLAVFRQAMTVRILPQAHGRRYSKTDYEPLALHHKERVFQVHVMNEYARLGLDKIRLALELVLSYFTLDKVEFVRRFFPERRDMLERATGQESYRKIVANLANPYQAEVVAAGEDGNRLILAGPGSGKTRTVVHRCAYLLRVLRTPPRSIVILCFNHYAAVSLRRRLFELAGNDARGVAIQTYHGLAMRLTGTSFHELAERGRGERLPFDELIPDAVRLLRGETELPGMEADEVRDRLLAGARHILVDEYQDIDTWQYELVSALAGRTETDPESRLTLLAVGDDDQNIYSFRGANVEFIRRFQSDYQAEIHLLLENYRSTGHIIAAANQLIEHNQDRMKSRRPIRINESRRGDPAGGRWSRLDPLAQGRVQCLQVRDGSHQAQTLLDECERLKSLDPDLKWPDLAVLARSRSTLADIRTACEARRIPFTWTLSGEKAPALHRLREVAFFLGRLGESREELTTATRLIEELRKLEVKTAREPGDPTLSNPWWRMLERILEEWREETADVPLPTSLAIEMVYETLLEARREQHLGGGMFLGTVHAAKGMEFPHVFIPDGDWRSPRTEKEAEEERRVFYVAMTRAKETLCLFTNEESQNPHMRLIEGDFTVRRQAPWQDPSHGPLPRLRYDTIGLQCLYIGFAGLFAKNHWIHKELAGLAPGHRLKARQHHDKIELCTEPGRRVARLSGQGLREWADRLDKIEEIRILGMIQRRKSDESIDYIDRCQTEKWEVPWIEIISSP